MMARRNPQSENKMRRHGTEDKMTGYRFVGSGLGVSGLPHEIESRASLTKQQIEQLDAALEAGTYEEVKAGKSQKTSDEDESGEDS